MTTHVHPATPMVEDLDTTYDEELRDRGAGFARPPERMPWGQKATWFDDPDGNRSFSVEG